MMVIGHFRYWRGSFIIGSFDTCGDVILSLHAEGTVVATGITVE